MKKNTIFLSYNHEIETFVAQVSHCLERQAVLETYFHPNNRCAGPFANQLNNGLQKSENFVFFVALTG